MSPDGRRTADYRKILRKSKRKMKGLASASSFPKGGHVDDRFS